MVSVMLWIREAGDDVSACRRRCQRFGVASRRNQTCYAEAKDSEAASRRHADTLPLTRTASSLKVLGYSAGE
jgi:hypothetical protein